MVSSEKSLGACYDAGIFQESFQVSDILVIIPKANYNIKPIPVLSSRVIRSRDKQCKDFFDFSYQI